MSGRILVTGATGFLGRHLQSALEAEGFEVTGLGSGACDLTKAGQLEAATTGEYEVIYHLAAWTQAGDFCLHHPGEQWVINQQINTNVLDYWHREQPGAKLVAIGTSCSYSPDLPLVEDNYLDGVPIDGLFTYAMTKRMAYAGLLALSRQFGHRYLCLVPSTLYGPGYHTDAKQMHFIFDLIRKILRAKLYGEKVVLWGDGHQRRELIYVRDFVSLALRLAAEQDDTLINIGAGEEFEIREFARLICDEVGYDPALIEYDTSRYVGARSKCLDTTRLRSVARDLRLTPLAEGLATTVEWMLSERDTMLPAPARGARGAEAPAHGAAPAAP